MLIECGKCGAPLDVGEAQVIAKCRYCGASSRVASTKTIAARTPAGWQAPDHWERARVARNRTVVIAAGATGLALVAGIAAVVTGIGGSTGAPGGAGAPARAAATPAEIAAIEPATTPADVQRRFPYAALGAEGGRIEMRDGPFEAVSLTWNDAGDHLVGAYLDPAEGADRSALLAALRPHLGHQLQDRSSGSQARWPCGSLSVNEDASVSWNVAPPGDREQVEWRRIAAAIWRVVRTAVLGGAGSIDPQTRALLAGHPLDRLANADITVTVDDAYRTLSTALPGTAASVLIGLGVTVRVDHPWFSGVTYNWPNAAGARLETMQIWSAGDAMADPEAIARCLTPVLGEPEVRVTDHLANQRRWTWNMGDTRWYDRGVGLETNHLWIAMTPGPDLVERHRAITTTLAACGR